MSDPQHPLVDYYAAPGIMRLAARMLRGWAVVNWLCTLLAIAVVAGLFWWQRGMLFRPGSDSFGGILVYTIGGCFAVACAAWGVLCWRLGSEVAACNLPCARIAQVLNLLLAVGCATSTGGLLLLRWSHGPLHWTGIEGHAWRTLFAAAAIFIAGTLMTSLTLWRAATDRS